MRITYLQVPVRGRVLRGAAILPEGAGPFPTAVLYHGFASTRHESGMFIALGRALEAAGVAAVAFDRAGHGESDGEFADTTVSADVADGLDVLSGVAGEPFVDAANVHLLGFSLGAVVASVVAAQSDVRVRSLTMVAVAAVFVDEIRAGNIQGRPFGDVDRPGFVVDFNGSRLGPAFIRDAVTFDVYGRARPFRGAVRLIHGDSDEIAPASYVTRYTDLYEGRARATIVPGADHSWMCLEHREALIGGAVDFIRTQAAGGD